MSILHIPCSSASVLPHIVSSARFPPRRHNSCVAKKATKQAKEAKDPLDVEMGRRLREAREKRKWSQEKLAEQTGWNPDHPKMGIHPSSIAMYERGERRVTIEAARTFSQIFGSPPPYWLALIDDYEADVLMAIQNRPRKAVASR